MQIQLYQGYIIRYSDSDDDTDQRIEPKMLEKQNASTCLIRILVQKTKRLERNRKERRAHPQRSAAGWISSLLCPCCSHSAGTRASSPAPGLRSCRPRTAPWARRTRSSPSPPRSAGPTWTSYGRTVGTAEYTLSQRLDMKAGMRRRSPQLKPFNNSH